MKRVRFFTLEGIEGCGKSTQMALLADYLQRKNVDILCTREPGGTEVGKEIRKILLSEKTNHLFAYAELFLYLADRFQHIREIIRPALERGKTVLCDRYHDSTIAYQGYGRGIPLEFIDFLWRNSGHGLDPDWTFLIDVAPEVGLKRSVAKLQTNRLDESRFEKEALDFHNRVRQGFLLLAQKYPERIGIVDGTGSVEEVHQKIIDHLEGII